MTGPSNTPLRLTREQRNEIYKAIARSGFDPGEFNLTLTDVKGVAYHQSGSFYQFQPSEDQFGKLMYRIHAIIEDGRIYDHNAPREFDRLIYDIEGWAGDLKIVLETPDLWTATKRSRKLIGDIQHTDSSNTPFTQDEQKQIAAKLEETKEQLRDGFDLSGDQMERIEEGLAEVAEASKRMGRKDWLIYFLGTITALIITATVTGGVGEHILTMVIHGLGHLFTGGNEPPIILA
jgi:hypothetical protein